MNMKKTIAAVAACAVAVSAMATTVSAEEGSLNYSLVVETKVATKTVDLTAVIANETVVTTIASESIVIKMTAPGVDFSKKIVKITGRNADTSKPIDRTFSIGNNASEGLVGFTALNSTNDTLTITIPVTSAVYKDFVNEGATAAARVTVNVSVTGCGTTIKDQDALSAAIVTNTIKTTTGTTPGDNGGSANAADVVIPMTGTLTKTEYTKRKPMKTTINSASAGTGDVIAQLGTAGVRNADGGFYNNVLAVLNDIIANYDDVTFTFNTATSGVITAANVAASRAEGGDWSGNTCEAFVDYYPDNLPGVESWMSSIDNQYKNFGQHLYNLYGDESTNYVYSSTYDWSYYNLFSGALVINNTLSMSLNDTNTFDYGATSLSFNWEDATEGANVNTYVTYLQSMKLATSTTWYWDSMDVVYADAADEESVESGEGTEAEEDTIGEDEEEVTDEEVVDEAEEEVEAPAEEEAPAAEETNPGTGNAPIALAVIPVALAAAAIVAKKRG